MADDGAGSFASKWRSVKARRRAVSALGVMIVGRGVVVILQGLTVALQARSLGVGAFGTYSAMVAILMLAMSVVDFGLGARVLRAATESDPGFARKALELRLFSLCLLPVVAAPALLTGTISDLGLGAAALAFVVGECTGDLVVALLLGERKRGLATTLLVARRCIGIAPFLFGLTESVFVVALLGSGFFGLGSLVFVLLRREATDHQYLAVIRGSVGYWVSSASTNIQRFDVLIISAAGGAYLTGLYSAATRFSNALNTGTNILLQYAIPEISHYDPSQRAPLYRRLIVAIGSLALGLIALIPASGLITQILLGSNYKAAAPLMAGVLAAAALSAMTQALFARSIIDGVSKSTAFAVAIAVAAGVLMLGAGAALAGVAGLSVALVAQAVAVLLSVVYSQRALRTPRLPANPGRT